MYRVIATVLLLLSCAALADAQVLPWRRQIEQRLRQQDALILQLLRERQAPPQVQPPPLWAPAPPLQIILQPPRQELPIPGEPKQQLPIPGEPKQPLPVPGEPKQPLPVPGEPLQPLPPGGLPRQDLRPQAYTIRIHALYYGRP